MAADGQTRPAVHQVILWPSTSRKRNNGISQERYIFYFRNPDWLTFKNNLYLDNISKIEIYITRNIIYLLKLQPVEIVKSLFTNLHFSCNSTCQNYPCFFFSGGSLINDIFLKSIGIFVMKNKSSSGSFVVFKFITNNNV